MTVPADVVPPKSVAELAAELERSAAHLRAVLDIAPVGIALAIDPEATDIRANRMMAEILGMNVADNVSKRQADGSSAPYRVFGTDGRELDPAELPLQLAASSGRRVDSEYLIVRADGSEVLTWGIAEPLFDGEGKVRGGTVAMLDITAQRRAEAEARAAAQRLASVLDRMSDGVAVYDAQLRLVYANRATSLAAGQPLDSIVGRSAAEVLGEGHEVFTSVFARVAAGGAAERVEALSEHFGRWYETDVYPNEQGVAVFFRDVTARHEAEAELRNTVKELEQAREAAEAANAAKDAFLSALSHELRTPLTAILGWAQALPMLKDPDDIVSAANAVESAARAQARLIEDLLDVARIGAGKLRINPSPSRLDVIARTAVEMSAAQAAEKRLELVTEMEPVVVHGDPGRLQQIVWNLASNAVKFTPPAGRIRISVRRDGTEAELVVDDNGEGIAPEFLPSIFDSFAQERESPPRGGLGLGLAIVKHLVEAHGGTVRAESEGRDRGSRFTVRLPAMESEN